MPHNIVQAIAQTSDGFLWVGTREGLARFDGLRFQTVELAPQVRRASVFSLLATRDGSLWAGTESEGLFRLKGNSVLRVPAPTGATNYSAYDLYESGNSVWVASSLGVLRWSEGVMEQRAGFKNSVESLCVDRDGAVWHFGSGGLKRLGPSPTTNCVPTQGVLPPDARKLYCHPDGSFWMASGTGVTCLKDGIATMHRKADGPAGFVDAFLTDHQGQLWMGAYAGLSRFVEGEFINEDGPDGPSYRVYTVFEDAEKTLWIGSEEGLARLTPRIFKTYTRRDGLTLNSVVSVCASRDGGMWVGIWGGGVNRIADGRITSIGKAEGLSSEFVMAMCEGRDGSLWVGADYGNPLNRIQNGRITQFGTNEGFLPATHTALLEDKDAALWIGTRDGLQCFRDGECRLYLRRDGLTHDKINALCPAADGGMWIGTAGGLTRHAGDVFDDLCGRIPALKTAVLCLYEDAESALWLGTENSGLLYLKGFDVHAFSTATGLLSDSIYSIQEDAEGNLWLNSSRGIFRVSKSDLLAVNEGRRTAVTAIGYGKTDGILSSSQYREVTQPASAKSTDGRLWFRTTQGVAVVDPARITTNRRPPPVVIEEVIGDKRTVWKRAGLEVPGEILVPKGRGELEIRYTALSLRTPERNRFRYRLHGIDPDWVEAGNRRSAYYNKVGPGEYRFEVTACNNDGFWNEAGKTLALRLEPHFWQTRWFLVACICSSIAGIFAIAVWITRSRMQREVRRLEQQHAIERERARIARDMHDELGAKLARISFQGATAKRLLEDPAQVGPQVEKMAETARELVSSLDEIVWAVDPGNDTLEHLAGYICRHASQFFDESPIACEFVIPESLPSLRLASDIRHHLFMAMKEALTNVMKHSRATRVRIEFALLEGELDLLIADNGIGLAASSETKAEPKLKRSGHGHSNIRERLTSLGGRADINSNANGTSIRLVLPLADASVCHPFI